MPFLMLFCPFLSAPPKKNATDLLVEVVFFIWLIFRDAPTIQKLPRLPQKNA
jgi:hypothetical protein